MMSYKTVKRQIKQQKTGWDTWINEARRQLDELKNRELGLRMVIGRLENFKNNGVPWPGADGYTVTQQAGTAKEAVPA